MTAGADDAQAVVLVTGAASGIGAATAERLAADGWLVVATDLRERESVRRCDVRDPRSVDAVVDACIANHGRLDALVNAAGAGNPVRFGDASDEIWLETLDVNLMGTVRVCRAAIPHFGAPRSPDAE